MKILITGGLGFLGGRIIDYLVKYTNYKILVTTTQDITKIQVNNNVNYINLNWNSQIEINNCCRNIDVIIHLLGPNASECQDNVELALNISVNYTQKLLISANKNKVKKIIYFSTAHVYSSPLVGLITETSSLKNQHPYAQSKIAAENLILKSLNKSNLSGLIIRLSNSFGPPVDTRPNCWMLIFNDFCKQAILNKKIVIKSKVNSIRNFVTITDVCSFIKYVIVNNFENFDSPIYNLGGELTISILEVANLIKSRCKINYGFDVEIIQNFEDENAEKVSLIYDIQKLKKIGFELENDYLKEIDNLLNFCNKNFIGHG